MENDLRLVEPSDADVPVWLVTKEALDGWLDAQPVAVGEWVAHHRFQAKPGSHMMVPGSGGSITGVILGVAEPMGKIGGHSQGVGECVSGSDGGSILGDSRQGCCELEPLSRIEVSRISYYRLQTVDNQFSSHHGVLVRNLIMNGRAVRLYRMCESVNCCIKRNVIGKIDR